MGRERGSTRNKRRCEKEFQCRLRLAYACGHLEVEIPRLADKIVRIRNGALRLGSDAFSTALAMQVLEKFAAFHAGPLAQKIEQRIFQPRIFGIVRLRRVAFKLRDIGGQSPG